MASPEFSVLPDFTCCMFLPSCSFNASFHTPEGFLHLLSVTGSICCTRTWHLWSRFLTQTPNYNQSTNSMVLHTQVVVCPHTLPPSLIHSALALSLESECEIPAHFHHLKHEQTFTPRKQKPLIQSKASLNCSTAQHPSGTHGPAPTRCPQHNHTTDKPTVPQQLPLGRFHSSPSAAF